MFFRREVEGTRLAPAAQLDIRQFVASVRHVSGREIWDLGERLSQLRLGGRRARFQIGLALLAESDLVENIGRVLAPPLAPADLPRECIPTRLDLLSSSQRLAPRLIISEHSLSVRWQPAPRQRRVERLGILANPPDVEHGRPARLPSWRSGTPLAEVPPHPLAALAPSP